MTKDSLFNNSIKRFAIINVDNVPIKLIKSIRAVIVIIKDNQIMFKQQD